MELVDTHCHLNFDKYGSALPQVLKRAEGAGVARMICVGTTLADSRAAIDLAAGHDNIWATAGIHPHDAESFVTSPTAKADYSKILNKSSICAAGEMGLDYYKNYSSREAQQQALRLQIEVALPIGLPFVFHVREAWEDFWEILDEYRNIKGVIHSFSSTPQHLEEALARGLYIGLNGIMTFTADHRQLAAAKAVPKERLVLETDAPFLTPAPERGKICEPRHIKNVAEFLAQLRSEPLQELAEYTTNNALRLFGLEKK
jgi:TatD DNase family protein